MREREARFLIIDIASDESLLDGLEYRLPCPVRFMTNLKVEIRKEGCRTNAKNIS